MASRVKEAVQNTVGFFAPTPKISPPAFVQRQQHVTVDPESPFGKGFVCFGGGYCV